MYTQLLPLKFTLERSTMSLLFKNYLLVEVIYLLVKFNETKSFLLNTNTDRNGINEQIKYNSHRVRKITLERVI